MTAPRVIPPRRFSLHPGDGLLVGALFGGAGGVLLVARMLEFSVAKGAGLERLGALFWSDAPVPTLLLLGAALAAWAVYGRATAYRAAAAAAAGVGAFAVGVALARWALPWGVLGWVDSRALAFLRVDLLILLATASVSVVLLALGAPRRWSRLAALGVAHALALGVVLIAATDIMVLLGTGARGGYFALRDVVANPVQLAPVLLSELSVGRAVLAAVPFVFLVAPHVLRRRLGGGRRVPVGEPIGVYVPLALLLAAVPADAGTLFPESSVVRLVTMTWADLQRDEDPPGADVGVNPFDLRGARLAVTDSTVRRNVVVLVLESVRRESTTPYTPSLPTTPFLDSLAREGVLVEEMFTTTPYTNKALVSAFGGIPPSLSPDIAEALPGGVPAPGLARMLRPLGYRSAFFTPATFTFENKDRILANLGFEEAYGDGDFETDGFEEKAYFGYEDRVVFDRALDWATRRHREGVPFFMGMLTLSSHHPYDVPEGAARLGLAPGNDELDAYYDALRYTDDFVRDLVRGFEERGLLEETAFVIVGDHGEAFGEHAEKAHGNVIWDEALRIPGIVYAPGLVPRGGRVGGPHQILDVAPTVADLLGARWEGPPPPGRSMLEAAPASRPLYHACKDGRLAVALRRDGRKYTYRYGRRPTQVFDLEADPAERWDVAAGTDRAEILGAETDLVEWVRHVRHAYARARRDRGVDVEAAPPSGRVHYRDTPAD